MNPNSDLKNNENVMAANAESSTIKAANAESATVGAGYAESRIIKGDNLGVGVVIVILVSAGIMVVFTVYRKLQRYQHEKAQYRRRNHRRKK